MVEMADIFRRYGPQYRAKYGDRMLPSHRQTMGAIERCCTRLWEDTSIPVRLVARPNTS
jgi:hypothetical protein